VRSLYSSGWQPRMLIPNTKEHLIFSQRRSDPLRERMTVFFEEF